MTRYSVEHKDRIIVKGCGFLSFSKNTGNNIGKNISKNLSRKCSQKLLDHAKKSATNTLKTTSKKIYKRPKATSDLLIK